MKAQEVTPEVIGKKVSCYAYQRNDVLGTIVAIIDNEKEVGVRILFDEPLVYYFEYKRMVATEFESTVSKHGYKNFLQYVEEIGKDYIKPLHYC